MNVFGVKKESNKPEMIRNMIQEKEIDIMGMAEVNVN